MISPQPWFERTFTFDLPLSRFSNILERLRGTPARVEDRVHTIPTDVILVRFRGAWSIQENIGHICDLEPIWIRRSEQLLEGQGELAVADLTNRATDEANHNNSQLDDILKRLRTLRFHLVSILEKADESALERTARHPRLGTPMRLIDVAFFVAEHDDHHLARITELFHLASSPHSLA